MKTRKTWRQKLEREQEPEVVDTPKGRMLIPRPLDVDALIRRIEEGKLATAGQIRERLAKDFDADFSCPMTTGIFIRIAAETAEEDLRSGREPIAPYWRVLRNDGSLNEKFPGGTEAQATRLRDEGHDLLPGKGSPRVRDFEKYLQSL